MSSTIEAALAAWRFPFWTSALELLTPARLRTTASEMPSCFTLRRLGFYLSGNAAVAIALVSPLEALDDRLLITHMLQHCD
jgi:cytochrome c oxidase assembly factor CtaG